MARSLFLTLRSPFARKVEMVLREKGLPYTQNVVDLRSRSTEFVAASPIGKVPVLVDDDGTVVLDSTVICEYLEDRYPEPRLRGRGWEARLAVRQVEELGDSLSDAAIALFFARQRGDETATDKASASVGRILDALEEAVDPNRGPFCGDLSYADFSVLAALGYLAFRHGDAWLVGRPDLAAWAQRMDERPSAISTRPRE